MDKEGLMKEAYNVVTHLLGNMARTIQNLTLDTSPLKVEVYPHLLYLSKGDKSSYLGYKNFWTDWGEKIQPFFWTLH